MRDHWTWKEGFQFALAVELLRKQAGPTPMGLAERVGAKILRPLYKVIQFVSKQIRRPVAIVLVTVVVAMFASVVFYNIPALVILSKIFPSKALRFLFFLYVETNLFAIGLCAFGRFNNRTLIELWRKGELMPLFPGDQRSMM